jgi:hypothetical protein
MIPEGYVTRARVEHLTKELEVGINDIFDRMIDRAAVLVVQASGGQATIQRILEEQIAIALREVDTARARFTAQLTAPEH